MDPPSISFIGIVDFSQEARWLFMTDSVTELLGFEPAELYGRPSLELVHPDEFARVRKLHYDTIQADKAAVLVYLRMRHKDPYKGYVLCGVSRSVGLFPSTVVHNVVVGSVSYATGAKALHNASTAQEITVISPSAAGFQFKRWNDPSPMPPSPVLSARRLSDPSDISRSRSRSPSPSKRDETITYAHLPSQSFRTAMILDRFSLNCTIMYVSNDLLLSTTTAMGRSFYDFVAKKDEDIVRSWIDVIKGWGVNERGQPSDGGFGFGRFSLYCEGRDAVSRAAEPSSSSSRQRHAPSSRSNRSSKTSSRPAPGRGRSAAQASPEGDSPQLSVDAIFSAHSDGLMVILRRAT
ncbi:hypothetical protein C8J56DRAFT_1124229 [Mycena floridula]|nr:hypothetical protein C8J56DRAFT_1124229 [Mycena floridula]